MLRSPMTMSASPLSSGSSSARDLVPGVLIVGVGVDDEVGAALERGVDAGGERRRQPLVPAQPDDVIDAGRARDIGRAVARSVVDDQDFDDVDARDGSRQFRQRRRQRVRLVEARDLDDELRQRVAWSVATGNLRNYGYSRGFGNQPTSVSMTPSQVIRRATSCPASPSAAARRRSAASRRDRVRQRPGCRLADVAVDAVDHELVRSARVGAGDDRLAREKRLERDVAEVLVVGRIDHRQRPRVELDERIVLDAAEERDAIRHAGRVRRRARRSRAACRRRRRSVAAPDRVCGHRPDDQIDALHRFDAADREHVVAVRARRQARRRAAADDRAPVAADR